MGKMRNFFLNTLGWKKLQVTLMGMSGKQSRAGSQGSIGEASALGIDEINLGRKKGAKRRRPWTKP